MGVGRLLYHIVHKQPAFRDGVDGLLHFKRSHYCSGCPSGEAAASNALNFNRSYSLHQPQDSTVSYITYNLLVNTLSSVLKWLELQMPYVSTINLFSHLNLKITPQGRLFYHHFNEENKDQRDYIICSSFEANTAYWDSNPCLYSLHYTILPLLKQTEGFYQNLDPHGDALPLSTSHWNSCLNSPGQDSQPWHYWHLGWDNSLGCVCMCVRGGGLCIVRYLTTFLVVKCQYFLPSCDNQNIPVPWGQNHPSWESLFSSMHLTSYSH